MLNIIFCIMIIISIVCAAFCGKMPELSNAAINSCVEAVELFIYLLGGMCMWGGLMRVTEKSGLTEKLAVVFRPAVKFLFKGLDPHGKAFRAICLNITANLLGLGNAATPLGIEAMKALKKEDGVTDTASRSMVIFTVLNTASITLIPSSVASLRILHGASEPLDIMPCVAVTSAAALTAALIVAVTAENFTKKGEPSLEHTDKLHNPRFYRDNNSVRAVQGR